MPKSFGANFLFAEERIDALMTEYCRYISAPGLIRLADFFVQVVNLPAPRFWVSFVRAKVVITKIMKGESISDMRPLKREMFIEIYNRVINIMNSDSSLSLSDAIMHVIESPAPKFYLAPDSAKIMIYKNKKLWFRKKLLKSRR